ncbi:MAG: hypothetical protein AB7O26_12155 [Planctomycetaceae bacterium]
MNCSPHQTAQYAADIAPVQEVSLVGTANRSYWADRLNPFGLLPQQFDGAARLVISAMQSKFLGLTFREVCIAVAAQCPKSDGGASDALFLLQAFNSSRLFAFSERVLFSTPYRHARIDVALKESATFRIPGEAAPRIDAHFDAGRRRSQGPIRTCEVRWEGPIFLPGSNSPGIARPQFFRARIAGLTTVWRFDGSADRFELATHDKLPIFAELHESGFAPREWQLRPFARHSRSKTFTAVE